MQHRKKFCVVRNSTKSVLFKTVQLDYYYIFFMTNSVSQVSAAGHALSPDASVEKPAPKPSFKEVSENARTAKIATGVGLATTLVLGIALKDGINEGFKRIGTFTNRISNLIAVPFSFLFPILLLDNERAALRGESRGKDDIFSRMTYTMASLVFTPLSFGDQLLAATKSKGHMIATLLNLHNTLYCLFSYTGGRLLGFITSLKMKFNKDETRKFRLEQEFEAFYTLANLGSSQVSVIPLAAQFVTGWQNIFDCVKGDSGSAVQRIKDEPASAIMGTFCSSIIWPFEWFSKLFDTTCRTAETVDSIENAFKDPDHSFVVRGLKGFRNWFHGIVQDKNSFLGSIAKPGRKISMNLATYLPPLGMMSTVWAGGNNYLKGNIYNKEAQEIGGITGFMDKIFSTAGFLGHVIYTIPYGLVVRLPQTATHGMFYLTRGINKMTGKNLDPHEIRKKMFEWGPFKALSNWAAKKLDNLELELHPDDLILINDLKLNEASGKAWINDKEISLSKDQLEGLKVYINKNKDRCSSDNDGNILIKGTGRNRNIRTRSEVIVQEICNVAKEKLYKQKVNESFFDEGLENEDKSKGRMKKIGEKPSDTQWGLDLTKEKAALERDAEKMLREYLARTEMLDPDQIEKYVSKYYYGNGLVTEDRFGRERKTIKEEFIKNLDAEISKLGHKAEKKPKIESKSLIELIFKKPHELWDILKLKTFHLTNTFLMFWVNGFVNSTDFGEKNDEGWESSLNTRLYAIKELDIKQACDRELMPVVSYGLQSMIEGWLLARSVPGALFGGGSLYSRADEPNHALAA